MLKNQLLITVLLMLFSVVSYGQIANEVQGSGSGASLTSADYVTFYGDSSGVNHTSGLNTTYIGYKAGYSQTVQADNTFIGAYSGEFATSGTEVECISEPSLGTIGERSEKQRGTIGKEKAGVNRV